MPSYRLTRSSLAALLCALGSSSLLLAPAPALAVCSFSGPGGPDVDLTCTDTFDDTLTVFEATDTATLTRSDGSTQTVISDGAGANAVTLSPSPGGPGTLSVFTNGDDLPDGNYLNLDDGDDPVVIENGGRFTGSIFGGDGDDSLVVTDGFVLPDPSVTNPLAGISYAGGDGDDTVTIGQGSDVLRVNLGAGDDVLDISANMGVNRTTNFGDDGTVGVDTGAGNDTVTINNVPGAGIDGTVVLGDGDDTLTMLGGAITGEYAFGDAFGNVLAGAGEDEVDIRSGSVEGNVNLGPDDDVVTIGAGGTVGGALILGAGDDTATTGGFIGGIVAGNGGTDSLTITGGSIDGRIVDVEDITFDGSGGGIFSGQFTIVAPGEGEGEGGAPLTTIDIREATFTNAIGGVSNLALDGPFAALNIDNSTISLFGNPDETLTLDAVNFRGGNVRLSGDFVVNGTDGGFGNATAFGTAFDLVNGRADDVFAVGNLSAGNTTVAFDVDPVANTADNIVVNGTFDPDFGTEPGEGNNLLRVAFTTDPVGQGEQIVQLVAVGEETLEDAEVTTDGTFAVETFSRAVIANFEVLEAPDGSTFLRYDGTGTPSDPSSATQDAIAVNGAEAVSDVADNLLDNVTGFAAAPAVAQVTPTFGIFSSGTAGRLWHDGFDVSVGNTDIGATPSFTADNFSAILTGELDASAEFGLEDIGVRVSAFGGYASSDVDLSADLPGGGTVLVPGGGINRSGVIGGAVLVSKIEGLGNLNYALLSTAGFFGRSDVTIAGNTEATGDYATTGWVLAAKAGRNIAIADRLRLDLRVGGSFNLFRGDSFTASDGRRFGASEVRYGTVSFEPGVSTAFQAGDAVVSPFARAVLGTRLGYDNSADIGANSFEFEDGDVFAGAQLGANVRITERLSAGALVEGRLSEDSETLAGKLSLKYTIPRS